MIYDMSGKPPKTGSVLEALCLMVQMRRQLIQLYGMHTVVQAVRTAQDESAEPVQASFKNYQDALMPFLKDEIDREHQALIKALREETRRGPLRIQALVSGAAGQLRRRLKSRKVQQPQKAAWRRNHGGLSAVRLPQRP